MSPISRRTALKISAASAAAFLSACNATHLASNTMSSDILDFDVHDYGAAGDGATNDTAAIQRAIDAAADSQAKLPRRVFLGGGATPKKYLVGTLQLRSNIDFHLAPNAELFASLNPAHYDSTTTILAAHNARNLTLSGTGVINGRSPEIMLQYDAKDEWYSPIPRWRPRLVVLTACTDLVIRDITLKQAPLWTLHLLGCQRAVLDNIKIRNQLDVPNCDGIDPDHCRDVEIKNCDIICGDDAIVIKTARTDVDYGPSENIHVHDCTLETQDAGLKIGTETTADIRRITFERCTIKSACRGLGIQLRDEGNVSDIIFRDITFTARYHSNPWWGRGEAISLTAIPRNADGLVGTLSNIRFENIAGRAENSVRIEGSPRSRIKNVSLNNVSLTLDRWTKYNTPETIDAKTGERGGKTGQFDNRPTRSQAEIEPHDTPGFSLRHADNVAFSDCKITWGRNIPDYFSRAVETEDVTGFTNFNFQGSDARS